MELSLKPALCAIVGIYTTAQTMITCTKRGRPTATEGGERERAGQGEAVNAVLGTVLADAAREGEGVRLRLASR